MILDNPNQVTCDSEPNQTELTVVEAKPIKYKRGENPNSRGNLRPIQKGEVLNAGGRPKTEHFSKFVRQFLDSPASHDKTQLEVMVQRLAKDEPKVLLYYAFGKPVETVEMTGANGSNLIPDNLIQAAIQVALNIQPKP